MPPKVVRLDGYYRDLLHGLMRLMCMCGIDNDMIIHLKGFKRTETYLEEYAIMATAFRAWVEHLQSHAPLPAAQEKAVHAWMADRCANECQER